MRSLTSIVMMLALASCSPATTATSPTTPPPGDPSSTTVQPAPPSTTGASAFDWQPGSSTCAELEDNVPNGVDDSAIALDTGILTFSWGASETETLQIMDDPTCTTDSDAWQFLIRQSMDPDKLYRAGLLCDFYQPLELLDPAPANLDTIVSALAEASTLCS